MNTPGKPDPVPAGEPNSPDDPSCEQLAFLAAALYPYVESEGYSHARAAADAALEVWQESDHALVEMRREREAKRERAREAEVKRRAMINSFMHTERQRPGDPAPFSRVESVTGYLRQVWSDENGEPCQQRNKVLQGYFFKCVENGYNCSEGDDWEYLKKVFWNDLLARERGGTLEWVPDEVNAMRKCFEPGKRPPKGKKSPAKRTKTKTKKAPAAKKGATGKKTESN